MGTFLSRQAEVRLLLFFLGFVVTFLFIRISVRMIRANVRWWPGNVTPGGLHVHHVVFGIVLVVASGVGGLVLDGDANGWRVAAAAVFGVGTALVLDEFALVLHLDDVYWNRQGRLSVDAIFLVIGLVGLLLLGVRPLGLDSTIATDSDGDPVRLSTVIGYLYVAPILILVVITLLKGKIWSGALGLFVPVLPLVGALRLARPGSPWAKWFHTRGSRRHDRALRREVQVRHRLIRVKIGFQELIAGRHDAGARQPDSGSPRIQTQALDRTARTRGLAALGAAAALVGVAACIALLTGGLSSGPGAFAGLVSGYVVPVSAGAVVLLFVLQPLLPAAREPTRRAALALFGGLVLCCLIGWALTEIFPGTLRDEFRRLLWASNEATGNLAELAFLHGRSGPAWLSVLLGCLGVGTVCVAVGAFFRLDKINWPISRIGSAEV